MFAPFVTVPVSLQYLGASLYGAWAAALSLTAVAVFADLGIGAGLMTKLATVTAGNDIARAKRLVSTAYLALSVAVLFCLILLWLSSLILDWAVVIGGSSSAGDRQIELLTLLTLSGFILNIVASLIIRVQYGMQQVGHSNVWQGAASLVGIVAVFAAARLDPGSGVFIAIVSFSPVFISIINTFIFFMGKSGRSVSPRLNQFSLADLKDLAGIGGRFLFITVLMSISLASDTWIVAQTASLPEVASYAIPARIFAMVGVVVSIFTTPLWPLNAAALHNGDITWVRAVTRKMVLVTSLTVAGLVGVGVLVGTQAITWWLSDAISPSKTLLCGLGLMVLVQAVAAPMFMVQNGGGVLGPQTIGYILYLAVVPVKWIVAENIGIAWIPVAGALLYCLFVWPAALIGYRRTLARPGNDEVEQLVEVK
jgi:O-antigen/teichoic acid export membrane protein